MTGTPVNATFILSLVILFDENKQMYYWKQWIEAAMIYVEQATKYC